MQASSSDQLIVVQDIPLKGQGLVAAAPIPRGTRILSEPPLFRVPRRGVDRKRVRALISESIATLEEEQRQAFFSLQNSFEDQDGAELGRVRTNALPLGSDATTGGIFLTCSRINHSCRPNSQNTWNEDLQKLTVHAGRDIEKGEEITIFYLSSLRCRTARLQELRDKFRFACACELCSLPVDQRRISDERCEEIAGLDASIGDGTSILFAPLQTLHNVHKVLNLLSEEGITDATIPRAYYDAFQIAITHGDVARAKVFAELAAAARVVLEGKDSPTVQRMESLATDPCQHYAYRQSGRWEAAADTIPRELSQNEFENWLWKKEPVRSPEYADLRNGAIFPAFRGLPEENDIDLEFWVSTDGLSYRPCKHWCFLAEITHVEEFLRLRLIVKDKTGDELPLAFYTDRKGGELQASSVREGFAVAVLYAQQHVFLDSSVGIRHENPSAIKVCCPCPS